MNTLNDIVHCELFRLPECRAVLLPVIVGRIKELLSGTLEVGFCYLSNPLLFLVFRWSLFAHVATTPLVVTIHCTNYTD